MRAKLATEQARRAQIVRAAIETIAACAGLSSTGLISYHFKNKQELVDVVFRPDPMSASSTRS